MAAFSTLDRVWLFSRLFKYGLDELRSAYEAARESPDREKTSLEERWRRFEAEVAEGEARMVEEDDEGNVIYDYGEHMGEMIAETQASTKYIREVFTIALYHFWERHVIKFGRMKEYDQEKAFRWLEGLGMKPDRVIINKLRLVANVAKHGAGHAARELYRTAPEYYDTATMDLPSGFSQNPSKPDYEFVTVTDAHIEQFFGVVMASWTPAKS